MKFVRAIWPFVGLVLIIAFMSAFKYSDELSNDEKLKSLRRSKSESAGSNNRKQAITVQRECRRRSLLCADPGYKRPVKSGRFERETRQFS